MIFRYKKILCNGNYQPEIPRESPCIKLGILHDLLRNLQGPGILKKLLRNPQGGFLKVSGAAVGVGMLRGT